MICMNKECPNYTAYASGTCLVCFSAYQAERIVELEAALKEEQAKYKNACADRDALRDTHEALARRR
jgi:hypothetical protein